MTKVGLFPLPGQLSASALIADGGLRRDNQLGNSVNLDGSVARGVTEGGRSPTGGTFLATARTHIGVHAVW
ncbi:hypothetical protein I7F95_03065 [Sinorhizobium meliloti]|nr:hypothetical protein [Sinorhizobium meliloti]MDE3776240.1 hypothetical protein [Sinorhizobium meliloti]